MNEWSISQYTSLVVLYLTSETPFNEIDNVEITLRQRKCLLKVVH